jgi:thiamine biosynthesis lipoprotein
LDLYYFNTQIHLQTNGKVNEQTLNKLNSLFSSLEKELSASNQDSTISKFNSGKANDKFFLSDDAIKVINISKFCHQLSNGKFNPSVLPLVKLWDFFPNYPILNFTPPTSDKISIEQSKVIDFSLIEIDEQNKTLTKSLDNTQIDFGGIVKGYALDKVAEILKDNGHTKGYISIGSSSLYILESESLGVKHPRASEREPLLLSVNLKGKSNLPVATSGDYEKSYSYEGKTYSHIIDPTTGYPADTGVASATIIGGLGGNGGEFDALTTALCLCSYDGEENSELVNMIKVILSNYNDAKIFVAVIKDGQKTLITNQIHGEDFTLLDKEFNIVKL